MPGERKGATVTPSGEHLNETVPGLGERKKVTESREDERNGVTGKGSGNGMVSGTGTPEEKPQGLLDRTGPRAVSHDCLRVMIVS